MGLSSTVAGIADAEIKATTVSVPAQLSMDPQEVQPMRPGIFSLQTPVTMSFDVCMPWEESLSQSAGTGAAGYFGDGGDAVRAQLNHPQSIRVGFNRPPVYNRHGKQRHTNSRSGQAVHRNDRRQWNCRVGRGWRTSRKRATASTFGRRHRCGRKFIYCR